MWCWRPMGRVARHAALDIRLAIRIASTAANRWLRMGLTTLKPRLATLKTDKVKVLEPKAGATQMERGRAWMSKRERVAQRFGYRCAECGLVLMPGKWECDHIVPREQGGSNDESNLQSLCAWTDEFGRKRGCHVEKTAKEAAERSKSWR